MAPKDLLVVVVLNGKVAALLKSSGEILWSVKLSGMMGDKFVTITTDDTHVYAYTTGRIHCLDMETGRTLWTNALKGYGYGIASICIPGIAAAPDPAIYAKIQSDRRSSSSSDTPSTT